MDFVKELSLGFLEVVERAAAASAKSLGLGDKMYADRLAVEAMRKEMETIEMAGRIVIGEGERDKAPMLFIGEKLGKQPNGKEFFEVDIAVDPLEGTTPCAMGIENSMAVLAASEKNGLIYAPDIYMDKIMVGPANRGNIDIDAPVKDNIDRIARGLSRDVSELVIAVLNRPRNMKVVDEIRACGARVKLISDGDLSAGISAAMHGTGVHAAMGVGGAPEGVLAAAALRCLNGDIQVKFYPSTDGDEERLEKMGLKGGFNKAYTRDELAPGSNIIFTASGVTDGPLLKGVRFFGKSIRLNSVIMTCNPTQRTIKFIENVVLESTDNEAISKN